MRLIAFVVIVAFGLSPAFAQTKGGDEAGTLKGVRGAPQAPPSGAPKTKPKGSGLMEDEGIFYKTKPSGTPKPR